ncbi:MAG: YlbG family protein [bacterium]|nr:YlbG family protein [bacterium]
MEENNVPVRKIRRRSLIIYYKQESALQALDENVRIVHKSNKFKYVIVYVDEKKVYETKKKLMNAKGIKDIIDSQFELESFDLLQNTQVL